MTIRLTIALVSLTFLSGCKQPETANPGQQCFDFWANTLKDPDSAAIETWALDPKDQVIMVKYRAKNSFGAYNIGIFECQATNGEIDLESTREKRFNDLRTSLSNQKP